MALIRSIAGQFDPVYLKPANLARALQELAPVKQVTVEQNSHRHRRFEDRRGGLDRRQRSERVLLDLRSPHARRLHSGRRDSEGDSLGLDVYV